MGPPSAASILLLGAALLGAACSPARHEVEGDIVHDVKFSGNGGLNSGHNDYQLRQQMEQQDSPFGTFTWPFLYWADPETLDEEALQRDSYRLEVWYAHKGWFDAQVKGWQIRQIRDRTAHRAGAVDIRGYVEPGPQSNVRNIEVAGAEAELQAVVNAALRASALQEGSAFSLDAAEGARDLLRDKLQDHARAYATVEMEIAAFPAELAVDVAFTVDAGIPCVLGPITIEGEEDVREEFIRERLEVEPGDTYRITDLRDARSRLFKLGTFSVLTVEADLSDPTVEEVPIRVKVHEAEFRRVRLGFGFEYDSYQPLVRASSRFTHVNLFHELLRAEFGAQVGVALSFTEDRPLPTWGFDTKVRYPRISHGKGALELTAMIEQDVYATLWTYLSPEVDFHFVWNWNDDVVFRVGPHFEQYTILTHDFDIEPQAETLKSLFGIENPDELAYQLTSLDQYAVWDWRDDPNRPTRGSYYALSFREAIKLSDVGTNLLRATGEARRYFPIRFRDRESAFPLTLAGKVRSTAVVPFGTTTTIPLPERAFEGGPNSIRGFRTNQVGPYSTVCVYDTTSRGSFFGLGGSEPYEVLSRYDLPYGGEFSGDVSGEVRYDWMGGITLAAFGDVGFLTQDIGNFGIENGRWSVGVGARYDTVVGPIRFDVSVRPLYDEDHGPVGGFQGCKASRWNGNTYVDDRKVRVNDLFANFPGLRAPADHPPFAIVFYITIGESI
jgi:outer membrane protein assembly factor BamA